GQRNRYQPKREQFPLFVMVDWASRCPGLPRDGRWCGGSALKYDNIVRILEEWERENGELLQRMQRAGWMGRQPLPSLWRRKPDRREAWRRTAGRPGNLPSHTDRLCDRAKSAPVGLLAE